MVLRKRDAPAHDYQDQIKARHRLNVEFCFSALNLSPRFHTIDEVAKALSSYFLGLSLRRVEAFFHVPRSIIQYYWRKLADYSSPPRVAVDENSI